MTEDSRPTLAIIISHCNNCGGDRNHDLLHCEKVTGSEQLDDNYTIDWWDKYEMLKCRGCGSITTRKTTYFSEAFDEITVSYFPPAVSRREPHWLHLMPDVTEFQRHPVAELFKEIYVALHNDSRRLAAMGIRTLLDCMMSEKVGDKGNFKDKLERLHDAKYISRIQKDNLEAIIEAGHASTHRSWNPSKDDLDILLDITESVLETIYIHEARTKKLAGRVPKRINKTA